MTTGVTRTSCVFQHFCISMARSLYFVSLVAVALTTLPSIGMVTSTNCQVLWFLSWITMSGLLYRTRLSVRRGLSYSMSTWPIVVVVCGSWSIQFSGTIPPNCFMQHQCRYLATWLWRCMYLVAARSLHLDTRWSTLSSCLPQILHSVGQGSPYMRIMIRRVGRACSCAAHRVASVSLLKSCFFVQWRDSVRATVVKSFVY